MLYRCAAPASPVFRCPGSHRTGAQRSFPPGCAPRIARTAGPICVDPAHWHFCGLDACDTHCALPDSRFPAAGFLESALRGCPRWMKYTLYGIFGYAVLNFIVMLAGTPSMNGPGPMPPSIVRGFSDHWMAFYAAAIALLYSAANVKDRDSGRHCPLGHAVGPLAQFCERCGQPVHDSPYRGMDQ